MLYSQDVKLDLTEVDTGVVVVQTTATIITDSTDSIVQVPVNGAGTMEMRMQHDETDHSLVKFDVSATGVISNVEWKPDEKDTTQYMPLDTGRYELKSGDKEIKFKGCSIQIDLSALDFSGFYLDYLDPVSGRSSGFGELGDGGVYDLFPGNYRLSAKGSNASIWILVMDDCQIDNKVYWKLGLEEEPDSTTTVWKRLHLDFFEVDGSKLTLLGYHIGVKMDLGVGQTAVLKDFKAGKALLTDDEEKLVSLAPGQYHIGLEMESKEVMEVQFEMLNETGRLSPTIFWQDHDGDLTGSQMVALEPGIVYVSPEKMDAGAGWPPPSVADAPLPYAVLKDRLDAGYYLAVDGELRLRYDERYEENTDLDLRILDENNAEVSLSSPVARHYGSNWISLTLPSTDFNAGQYYVLEVKSEKGDLTMLRFRYE